MVTFCKSKRILFLLKLYRTSLIIAFISNKAVACSSKSGSSDSSGNSDSDSEGLFGQKWTGAVYFDEEADPEGNLRIWGATNNQTIKGDKVLEHLLYLIATLEDPREKIAKVSTYQNHLFKKHLTQFISYHAYVVLEIANGHFWTVEKNTEGITIQRSTKGLENVRDWYRKTQRRGVNLLKSSHARDDVKMGNLAFWFKEYDELHKPYNVLTDNCKDFAQRLYCQLTPCKSCDSRFAGWV